jgi:hypothetical protein
MRTTPQRKRAEIEAKIAIAFFNVRALTRFPVLSWPTFRAAELAKRRFLLVECPGCRQRAALDLRDISAHPDASINSLTPYFNCRRCQPQPPLPWLIGLRKRKPQAGR